MKTLLSIVASSVVVAACGSFGTADDAPPPPPPPTTIDGGVEASGIDASTWDAIGPTDPRTIVAVSSQPIPWIALDATRVIFSNGSPEGGPVTPLFACPKTGCPGKTPNPLTLDLPIATISSDGTTVVVGYHSQGRGLDRLEGEVLVPLVSGINSVDASVVRDGKAYFVLFNTAGAFSRMLYSVPTAGGTATLIGTYAPGNGINSSHVAIAKERAFFGSHSTGNIGSCLLGPPGGCGEFLSLDAAFALALATDDTRIFWGNGDTVLSCSVGDTSCVPHPELPATLGRAWNIIAKDGELFMTMASGALLSCTSNDCASTRKVLVEGETFDATYSVSANNVAVDADAVYYVTHVGAEYRIMRLPRTSQ